MKKITTKNNILKQIETQIKQNQLNYKQIDAMQLYCNKNFMNNNQIDFISYSTPIIKYDINKNILYITSKKYSRTTTKQQNKIKDNFIKYNNSKIIYTNEI